MQIKKIFFIFLSVCIPAAYAMMYHHHTKEYIVILDPAGDAKKTGRVIGDSFERGLTLQCAEHIKTLLEQQSPHIKVIISRLPGDTVYELQNASLSNRLAADLFVNINFYQTKDTKQTLFLYQFCCNNDFVPYESGLAFNTYDQAYKINKDTTDELIELCAKHLTQQKYTSLFSVSGPYALPIKPLIGIISPSICIEAGLKNKDSWQLLVEPLVGGIVEMVGKL